MSGPTDNQGGFAPVLVAAGQDDVRASIEARLETIGPIVSTATAAEAVLAASIGIRVAVVVPPLSDSEGVGVIDDLRACVPLCPVVAIVDDLESELARACAAREHVVLLATSAVASEVLLVAVRAARSSADSAAARLQRARSVFQHLREAVLVHSPTGRIVLANPAADVLLGTDDPDARAVRLRARDGDEVMADSTPVAVALRERRPVGPVVLELVRADRTVRLVDCVAHPLAGPNGGPPYGVVSLWRDVTEDEARRSALFAAERLQNALLDHGYEAHLIIDGTGCVAAAQGSAAGLLSPATLVGQPIEEIFHPSDRSALAALLAAAASPENGVVRAELRVLDASGGVRFAEIAAACHRSEPSVAGIVLSLHDVTRRRSLTDSVARLAAIVDNSEDALVAEAEHGRITAWNPAAERLYGTSAAEALGELSAEVVPWRQRPDVRALAEALRSGETIRAEQRVEMLRRDGTAVAVELTGLAVRRHDGALAGIDWLARDVAASGAAAGERAPEYRLGFEHAAVGMALVDAEERVTDANTALCRFLGRPVAQVRGRRLEDFLHPADTGPSESLIPLVAGDRRHQRDERRYIRPDGAVVWGHTELVRVDDPNGGRPTYLAQLEDVTERRLAEEALAHQARHDPLTGLPNAILLADRLGQALKRAHRNGLWVALIVVDVDHFGALNDRLGRATADRLLVEIANRVAGGVRASDSVARAGGDGFAIVCEEIADDSGARKLADTIMSLFADPFRIEDTDVRVGISCGVVLLGPHVTVEDALQYGDAALDAARAEGGNHATVVDRTAPGANLKVVQ